MLLSCNLNQDVTHHPLPLGFRLGEAQNPGPSDTVTIGCTNPGGLRMKEPLALQHGPGIWSFSETHLSCYTQVSAARSIKRIAQDNGRSVRSFFGAPAPLRSRSQWAGKHTGVAVLSDYRSKHLKIDWPILAP